MAYSVINFEQGPSSLDKIRGGVGGCKIGWDIAMPAYGDYKPGDIIYNSAVATGGPSGWICVVAGSPGTWTTLPETVA